jgi:hypothetical protein
LTRLTWPPHLQAYREAQEDLRKALLAGGSLPLLVGCVCVCVCAVLSCREALREPLLASLD